MEENKNKKNVIIGLIAVVAIVIVLFAVVKLFMPSPEKTVKKFCKYMNKGEISKAFELVDFESMYVLSELEEDEYEDYAKEYKDFKDDEDEQEEYEDGMEYIDEIIEELEEKAEEYDKFSVELDKISSTKKEGKKIWKVKAKVDYKFEYEDEDIDTDENEKLEFYVIKKGMKYYIATGDGLETLMSAGSYGYYY